MVTKIQYDPAGEPFVFSLPGSKKSWKLPHADDLPVGIKAALAAAAEPIQRAKEQGVEPTNEQLSKLGEVNMKMLEDYCPGLSDQIPAHGYRALLEAWQEHCGITMGESQASAD